MFVNHNPQSNTANKIGDEGANAISEALKENKSLTTLSLESEYLQAEIVIYILTKPQTQTIRYLRPS